MHIENFFLLYQSMVMTTVQEARNTLVPLERRITAMQNKVITE